jgi:Do/DeqQ family serine protease
MDTRAFLRSRAFLVAVVAMAAGASGFLLGHWVRPAAPEAVLAPQAALATAPVSGGDLKEGLKTLSDMQSSFRDVAQQVLPSVVEIDVVQTVARTTLNVPSPFDFFFAPQGPGDTSQERPYTREGLGSGIIVRKTADKVYVLTNNHVVGQANQISVKLSDGRQYTAELTGRDEKRDLALLSFQTQESVPVAELGDSDTVRVGDWVLAVGSPLGYESTVTAGIVSAIGRVPLAGSDISSFTDYIQTDAAINEGNSGGALVNINGEVIGISSWIASPSGGSVGLGFAIPINNARKDIQDFLTKGEVQYGWLGVSIGGLASPDAQALGLADGQGAFVYGVYRGSPAEKTGLQPGDFITAVNGEDVQDTTGLLVLVGNLTPGETAELRLTREGRPLTMSVTVTQRQPDSQLSGGELWPGFSVTQVTDEIRSQLGLPRNSGDLVVGSVTPDSAAAVAGLKPGDLLLKVEGTPVRSVADFYRALNAHEGGELVFSVGRQGTSLSLGLVQP